MEYKDQNSVTPAEEKQLGNYRLLKARRQSEAYLDRTSGSLQSLKSTQPTTASSSSAKMSSSK